jgi:DNA-binding NarL/FixJ family response regulator
MRNFALYFLERQLAAEEVISESASNEAIDAKGIKRLLNKISKSQRSHFDSKYPNLQKSDIEDAISEAKKEVKKQKPESEKSAKIMFKKTVDQILSGLKSRKKEIKRSLSCVKALKIPSDKPISHLVKKADNMLTAQERRVLELCSQGKSVRAIGHEIDKSFPTAWRILNSAIDKIRMSHGMGSRHKDIRR